MSRFWFVVFISIKQSSALVNKIKLPKNGANFQILINRCKMDDNSNCVQGPFPGYPFLLATQMQQMSMINPEKPQQIVRRKFTAEEDEFLRGLVAQYGTSDWSIIASRFPNRNARQCRERWKNYLQPGVENPQWTPDEDKLLIEKVRELGSQWTKIAKFFHARTDINVKNRWVHFKKSEHFITEPPTATETCVESHDKTIVPAAPDNNT